MDALRRLAGLAGQSDRVSELYMYIHDTHSIALITDTEIAVRSTHK